MTSSRMVSWPAGTSTRRQVSCRRRRLVALDEGSAAAQAQLHQARALAHEDAERARGDLDVEAALVAGIDAVEHRGLIGDDAGEDVEPAGGALGVGDAGDAAGERQLLHQRDDVDAALLQHCALAEIDLVHAELLDLLSTVAPAPGRKLARTR